MLLSLGRDARLNVTAAALATCPPLDSGRKRFGEKASRKAQGAAQGSVREPISTATRPNAERGSGGDKGGDHKAWYFAKDQGNRAVAGATEPGA